MAEENENKLGAANLADQNKRREAARIAMEGRDRRAARVARERELAAKRQTAEAIQNDLTKRRQELEQKRQAEAAAEQAKLTTEERASRERQAQARSSQTTALNLQQTKAVGLSPLRTLKTDTARLVEAQKVSLAQIAIREDERNRLAPNLVRQADRGNRLIVRTLVTVIVLVLIGGGAGYWWWQSQTSNPIPLGPTLSPILPAENNRGFDLTATSSAPKVLANLKQELAKPATGSGRLTYWYFTLTATSSQTRQLETTVLTLPNWLSRSGWVLDQSVAKTLAPDFMLGSYDGATTRSVFWIFRIRSFDPLAAALLATGDHIANQLFGPLTNSVWLSLISSHTFIDRTIKNQDVRVISDDAGQTILIYSLLNRDLLVLAQDEAALTKILDLYRLPR